MFLVYIYWKPFPEVKQSGHILEECNSPITKELKSLIMKNFPPTGNRNVFIISDL